MKVLLICDDYWHPGNVPIEGAASLAKQGFEFDTITNANDFSPEMLKQYKTVLLVKCDETSQEDKSPWKTEDVQKAFVDFVENGGGLVAVHSATVCGKNTEVLDKLIGCRFTGHPNANPVTVAPVKKHPVTEGVELFCETDEHYHIEIISPDVDILLASYSPAQGEKNKYKEDPYHNCPESIQTAGFVRVQGKGRVCVLTPGHDLNIWVNTQFQKLLINALNWCSSEFITV